MLHGTRAISPEAKFVVICIGVALVHLHFTIAFAICTIEYIQSGSYTFLYVPLLCKPEKETVCVYLCIVRNRDIVSFKYGFYPAGMGLGFYVVYDCVSSGCILSVLYVDQQDPEYCNTGIYFNSGCHMLSYGYWDQ